MNNRALKEISRASMAIFAMAYNEMIDYTNSQSISKEDLVQSLTDEPETMSRWVEMVTGPQYAGLPYYIKNTYKAYSGFQDTGFPILLAQQAINMLNSNGEEI
jgi:hypothetical protein